MIVRMKRMRDNAPEPRRATEGAAGFDLGVCTYGHTDGDYYIDTHGYIYCDSYYDPILLPLGYAFEIPAGHVGILAPRSSKNHWLLTGYIDSDYRGEVHAKTTAALLRQHRPSFAFGDRLMQLIIVPVPQVELVTVEELSETPRGTGGFGSTGR